MLGVLAPFCLSTADIYGADDINNLLEKFPDIEKASFKLWLTSTAILERVLAANIVNFSDQGREYVERHFSRFVENTSIKRAEKILKEHHYCIIAGQPGIGKTTLAHVLLSEYIASGFELVSISHDIEEAWKLYKPETKQVFYYDDFLGQTSLQEKLGKNEDDRLLKFINLMSTTKDAFFILTTREYILNQAARMHEKIARSAKGFEKCIIKLSDYTQLKKAEILYNHIFFSDLEADKKLQLLDKDVYARILNHENYNPRLIEDITDRKFVKQYSDLEYSKAVIAYFDNPAAIWSHAFQNQLSHEARVLLLCLATFPTRALYSELEAAFNKTYGAFAENYKWSQSQYDFKNALKELEGSPVKITKFYTGYGEHQREQWAVEFENPSIRDFIENHFLSESQLVRGLFNTATYFEQAAYLIGLDVGTQEKGVQEHLLPLEEALIQKLYSLLKSSIREIVVSGDIDDLSERTTHLQLNSCESKKMYKLIYLVINKLPSLTAALKSYIEDFFKNFNADASTLEGMINFDTGMFELRQIKDLKYEVDLDILRKGIVKSCESFNDYYLASEYLFSDEPKDEVLEKIYEEAHSEVKHLVSDDYITPSELEDLKEKISYFRKNHDFDIRDLEAIIEERITELEHQEELREMQDDDDYRGRGTYTIDKASPQRVETEQEIIDDMFGHLKSSLKD